MSQKQIYHLTFEQQMLYAVQPDMILGYDRSVDEELEHTHHIKGGSIRFWHNTQAVDFSNHWHTSVEIIMPLEEGYTVYIQQQEYVLQEGDIFIIPAGTVHALHSPDKGSRFIFLFELDLLSQLPGFNYILSLMSQPIHIPHDDQSEFYREEATLMMRLADYYWGNSITKEMYIFACLVTFFAKVGEHTINSLPPASNTTAKSGPLVGRLSMVLDYLDTHYSENITLEEAAGIANFSKFYFTRLFKQYTNQTFYDYLSSRRIQAAEQMLTVPNLAITEISLKSGFSSLSSFNRTFKRLKGCSPSEYRSLYTVGRLKNDHLKH
ncbi:MAG: AraC family transcriptional regulator [Roseburia sp.]|nr:AraC family transcriptional regulator [Roseburia sp.]